MQITTLRKSGALDNEEFELAKSKYSKWVKGGCAPSKEMSEVVVPRLIKTVEILKSRLEYEARLESQVTALQGQLNSLTQTLQSAKPQPMKTVSTSRKSPAPTEWQSVQELSEHMNLSTSYLHNMATGAAKNRHCIARRASKAKGRSYDYRVLPPKA